MKNRIAALNVRDVVRCVHVASLRFQLVYYRGQDARQLILVEVKALQRRELPDLRRQARQLIALESQIRQRRELASFRRTNVPGNVRRDGSVFEQILAKASKQSFK